MLREIWQEIIKLQKNQKFLSNMILLGILTLTFSWSLAEQYHHFMASPKKQRLERFSPFISAGIVIRTYDTLLDKKDTWQELLDKFLVSVAKKSSEPKISINTKLLNRNPNKQKNNISLPSNISLFKNWGLGGLNKFWQPNKLD